MNPDTVFVGRVDEESVLEEFNAVRVVEWSRSVEGCKAIG